MLSSRYAQFANGFIGGVVVTASISYSLLQRERNSNVSSGSPSDGAVNTERFPFGKPVDLRQTIDYPGHTVYHDAVRKQPLWVSQVLCKDSIKGRANRRHSKFRRDDRVEEGYAAENSDYLKSGWSRGHMAPAGDFKYSQEAMDDTFLLSNIVPQNYENNSGFWNRFEMYCRDLTAKFEKIHVISGPLYQSNKCLGDKSFVEYEVIGTKQVPAPTHLYKVVMAYNTTDDIPAIGAFVVPNRPIAKEEDDLKLYQVPLQGLQSLTGFKFHPQLNADGRKTTNLCESSKGNSCKLSNWKSLELYFASKKVEYAKSQKDIDNILESLKKQNVKPDKTVLSAINKRKVKLENYHSQPRDSRSG